MSRTVDTSGGGLTLRPVVSGVLYAYVCTALCAVIYALVITSMPMAERHLPLIARLAVMASAFIGGLAAGHKSNHVGWLHGALVGLVYIVLTMAVGRLTSPADLSASIVVQRMVITIIVSAIGGIAGVNL